MEKIEVNGQIEFVDSHNLPDLIEEHMGKDTALLVKEYIKNSDYNHVKLNSDLRSYELSLEEYRYILADIDAIAEDLYDYIDKAKRLNRNEIKERLREILKLI